MKIKSKVYAKADVQGRITHCEGGYTTPADLTGWVQIDEGTGDRYNLCQSHYFEGGAYTMDGIPRYKLVDGAVVARTEDELADDRAAIPEPGPTAIEQLQAENRLLSAQIQAQTERSDFVEDCMAEMAMQVYAE